MNKMTSSSSADIGWAVLAVLLLPVSPVLNAFALRSLWAWFVVPQFHIASLSLVVAWGLCLIASLLTLTRARTVTHSDEDAKTSQMRGDILCILVKPLSLLLTGYILHHYV